MTVRPTREMIDNLHLRCEVEVDGGGEEETAPLAYAVRPMSFIQGFTPDDIGRVGGGNYCRIFGKVTAGHA